MMNHPELNHIDGYNISQFSRALIIGSGPSVAKYPTLQDFPHYDKDTLVITVNYAPSKYAGHLNWCMDVQVVQFLLTIYKPNGTKYVAIENAQYKHKHTEEQYALMSKMLDYTYRASDPFACNLTLPTAIRWVHHIRPMPIFLYGFDGKNPGKKWYQDTVPAGVDEYGKKADQRSLDLSENHLKGMKYSHLILNCNPDSNYTVFRKITK